MKVKKIVYAGVQEKESIAKKLFFLIFKKYVYIYNKK